MGTLARRGKAEGACLRARHLVGRSPACHLRLDDPRVSAEHAAIAWSGRGWHVRDLGSLNGTWVDGERLPSGGAAPIEAGARLQFGGEAEAWELVTDEAPVARAVCLEDGRMRLAVDELIPLPDAEEPAALVFRDARGDWSLEHDEGGRPVASGDRVAVAGSVWELDLPEPVPGTSSDRGPPTVSLVGARLRFEVSPDQEYVRLELEHAAGVADLAARSHNETLLVLARARLEDRAQGLGEASEGWRYADDVARMVGVEGNQLNVAVFRARRHLAEAGVIGAVDVVERRAPTRQLRLGVADVAIHELG